MVMPPRKKWTRPMPVFSRASDDFSDQMVPFRCAFQVWINYAEFVIGNTEEGTRREMLKPALRICLRRPSMMQINVIESQKT